MPNKYFRIKKEKTKKLIQKRIFDCVRALRCPDSYFLFLHSENPKIRSAFLPSHDVAL